MSVICTKALHSNSIQGKGETIINLEIRSLYLVVHTLSNNSSAF